MDNFEYRNYTTEEYMRHIASLNANYTQDVYDQSDYRQNYTDSYDYNAENSYNPYVHQQTNRKKINRNRTKRKKLFDNPILRKFAVTTMIAIVFGVFAGISFNFIVKDSINDLSEARKVIENNVPTTNVFTEDKGSENLKLTSGIGVSEIADEIMASMVSIDVKAVQTYYSFFGGGQEYEVEGTGTGIIVDSDKEELLIITNNHVISDAKEVNITFIDKLTYKAKIVLTDEEIDLALIAIDLDELSEDTLAQIKMASLGESKEIKVGEQVVAIGNALGYGQSVTTGIVSALNRINTTTIATLIQTDAAINPGNSGGALVNLRGEVIGINSSKFASTEVEGIGYAIPVSEAKQLIEEYKED